MRGVCSNICAKPREQSQDTNSQKFMSIREIRVYSFPFVSMAETDWEARYQSGDMPWEKGEPSPGLVDFLGAQPELRRGTVVVPGCGTGHDVRAWSAAGFTAT